MTAQCFRLKSLFVFFHKAKGYTHSKVCEYDCQIMKGKVFQNFQVSLLHATIGTSYDYSCHMQHSDSLECITTAIIANIKQPLLWSKTSQKLKTEFDNNLPILLFMLLTCTLGFLNKQHCRIWICCLVTCKYLLYFVLLSAISL